MERKDLSNKLNQVVPGSVLEVRPFGRAGEVSAWIELKSIQKVARAIKDDEELGLDWLENLSVSEIDGTLLLTYFVRSTQTGNTMILRATTLPEKSDAEADVLSVVGIWSMAKSMELEVGELFGIRFVGNPRPKNNLVPESVKGFPLRKEFLKKGTA